MLLLSACHSLSRFKKRSSQWFRKRFLLAHEGRMIEPLARSPERGITPGVEGGRDVLVMGERPTTKGRVRAGKQPQTLATKVLPPRCVGLVERPRLLEFIRQVQMKRLSVIKALRDLARHLWRPHGQTDCCRVAAHLRGSRSMPMTTSPRNFCSMWRTRCNAPGTARVVLPSISSSKHP